MLGSALFSSNSLATSVYPSNDAAYSGVWPYCGDNSNETYTEHNTDMPTTLCHFYKFINN